MRYYLCLLIFILTACSASSVDAPISSQTLPPSTQTHGDADIEFVRIVQTGVDTYTFHVTVHHDDVGWEDYADGWDVVLPDGHLVQKDGDETAFTRLLLHPHETEQPFTRSQDNLVISAETVTVRAHDLVHGFGGQTVTVDMTASEGDRFVIERD